MPDMNSVMTKECCVFKICYKENKATDESGVIAEYLKALEVEDAET